MPSEQELTSKLFNIAEDIIIETDKKHSLNVLKCLQTYRNCPSIEVLLTHKPELVTEIDELYKLWKTFDTMSEKELSDLAIELIHESW